MERPREEEADAVAVDGMFDGVARHVQIVTEFGQHIRRPALTRNGPVAVLCNRHTRARRDKRGGCRDIERRAAVAACADHIDTWFGDMDRIGVFSQILRRANQLGDAFAFHFQRGKKGSGLRVVVGVRHFVEHVGGFLFGQILPVHDFFQ